MATCFICGHNIKRQLGFNPAALTTQNCEILKTLRTSWSNSLCNLLDVSDKKCQLLLHSVPYCMSCHEVICNVDFIMNTIERLQAKLLKVKKKIKSLLRRNSKKPQSEHRELIKEVLVVNGFDHRSAQAETVTDYKDLDVHDAALLCRDPVETPVSLGLSPPAQTDDAENEVQLKNEIEDCGMDNDDPEWSPPEQSSKVSKKRKRSSFKSPSSSTPRKRKYSYIKKEQTPRNIQLKSYTCPVCQEVILGYNAMTRHTKQCRLVHYNFSCQYCLKKLDSEDEVKVHENLHEPFLTHKPFTCVFCSTEFRSMFDLQKHVAAEHDTNVLRFSCDLCTMTFHNAENLNRHKKRKHLIGITKMLQCPQCPFQALFPSILKYHSWRHGEKKHKCDIGNCTQCFFDRKGLAAHKVRVHGSGRFACTLCTRKFTTAHGLRNHQIYHSTMRPFMCEVCSSTFKTDRNLRTHIKVHAENKVSGDNLKLRNPRKARLSNNRLSKTEPSGSEEEENTGKIQVTIDTYTTGN